MAIKCSNCGAELKEESNFCDICGHKQEKVESKNLPKSNNNDIREEDSNDTEAENQGAGAGIWAGIIMTILGIIDCRNAIGTFLGGSFVITSLVLSVLLTIWWRNHFVYVTNDIVKSWGQTFIGSFAVVCITFGFLIHPLSWCIDLFFDWWYIFAGIAFVYGANQRKKKNNS